MRDCKSAIVARATSPTPRALALEGSGGLHTCVAGPLYMASITLTWPHLTGVTKGWFFWPQRR